MSSASSRPVGAPRAAGVHGHHAQRAGRGHHRQRAEGGDQQVAVVVVARNDQQRQAGRVQQLARPRVDLRAGHVGHVAADQQRVGHRVHGHHGRDRPLAPVHRGRVVRSQVQVGQLGQHGQAGAIPAARAAASASSTSVSASLV